MYNFILSYAACAKRWQFKGLVIIDNDPIENLVGQDARGVDDDCYRHDRYQTQSLMMKTTIPVLNRDQRLSCR
jgi:hypothetical protein